jgi:pantothenate kinase-related protein Tda10
MLKQDLKKHEDNCLVPCRYCKKKMLKEKPNYILEKKYLSFLATQEARSKPFHDKLNQLNKFYLPICKKIYLDYKKDGKIKIVGLTGGQGAGKSTITQILKLILD